MGGAVGHLMHPYDDDDMTLEGLKNIISSAYSGNLKDATEKLDGLNIVFSWTPEAGLVAARNAGDLKKKEPIPWKEVSSRFSDRPSLSQAFDSGLGFLSENISKINRDQLVSLFENARTWFSAEIICSENPNVIRYSKNAIVVHRTPVWTKDVAGVPVVLASDDAERSFSLLSGMFNGLLPSGSDWILTSSIPAKIPAGSNDSALKEALDLLSKEFCSLGLGSNSTVGDYLLECAKLAVKEYFFSEDLQLRVANRIVFGDPDLRALKKSAPKDLEKKIDEAVKTNTKIRSIALAPIAKVFAKFSSQILSDLAPSFVDDPKSESCRIKKEFFAASKKLLESEDPKEAEFARGQLNRLDVDDLQTPAIEGIVFSWRNRTYKLTGTFSVVNQILGYTRYKE